MNTPPGVWAHRPQQGLAGAEDGPLRGLRFSAKDLYGVPGWPLRAGTRAPLPSVGPSPLVAQLLAAGASLMGTTQLHEVALGITGHNAFGGTPNPLDGTRVAGGSSGGAAASVALGEVDFALGTDTGGSVRIPAALCGVAGFKPTRGLYSTEGVLPLSLTCDHAGTLARHVSLLCRVHEVVTGQEVDAKTWAGQRVGLWQVPSWVVPGAWDALLEVAGQVGALGAEVRAFEFPDVLDTYTPIVLSEAAAVHQKALQEAEPGFTAPTLELLRRGAALSREEVQGARQRREDLMGQLQTLFTSFDVLLAPTVPDVAPLNGQTELLLPEGSVPVRQAALRLTAPWSLLGVPVLSLPRPLNALSVGVQLIAPWNADAALLALGQRLAPLLEESL